MKEVISVNIGETKEVTWRNKTIQTGIFKHSVNRPIELGKEDVVSDHVVDRRYHGGIDKAVYIYSADHYAFWKKKYPELSLEFGMFGENITIKGLQENEIQIGDIYSIGECRIQVTQPREPCFKLGIRFDSQKIVKDFINAPYPGFYAKVIETGLVKKGDDLQLSERLHNTITLLEVWDLLYAKNPDLDLLSFAVDFQHLSDACRKTLRTRLAKLAD